MHFIKTGVDYPDAARAYDLPGQQSPFHDCEDHDKRDIEPVEGFEPTRRRSNGRTAGEEEVDEAVQNVDQAAVSSTEEQKWRCLSGVVSVVGQAKGILACRGGRASDVVGCSSVANRYEYCESIKKKTPQSAPLSPL